MLFFSFSPAKILKLVLLCRFLGKVSMFAVYELYCMNNGCCFYFGGQE